MEQSSSDVLTEPGRMLDPDVAIICLCHIETGMLIRSRSNPQSS